MSMNLKCKTCGFTRPWFHGWAFIDRTCSGITEGYKAMLHNWELVNE